MSLARVASADPGPTALQIIDSADKVRNPQQAFRVSMSLFEYVGGTQRGATGLLLHSRTVPGANQFKNLVSYAAPPRDVGKRLLMSGGDMWFYDPASKASVRISAQQRLVGQASNGDVLAVNLAHDYDPKLVGEETIQDVDHASRIAWHLDLAASTRDAMYARLEYWIEKDTYHPIKAKFYSDSGRLLKIAFYCRYELHLGGERPTETIVIDAVDPKLVTKIVYSNYNADDLGEAWFQRDALPRVKDE